MPRSPSSRDTRSECGASESRGCQAWREERAHRRAEPARRWTFRPRVAASAEPTPWSFVACCRRENDGREPSVGFRQQLAFIQVSSERRYVGGVVGGEGGIRPPSRYALRRDLILSVLHPSHGSPSRSSRFGASSDERGMAERVGFAPLLVVENKELTGFRSSQSARNAQRPR
jgi:hypothetical protein